MFSRLQVLDEGRLERRTFGRKIESLGTSLSSASKIDNDIGHLGFMCSSFVNMLFFDSRLLLSRRRKRVEVFMTVVMYPVTMFLLGFLATFICFCITVLLYFIVICILW